MGDSSNPTILSVGCLTMLSVPRLYKVDEKTINGSVVIGEIEIGGENRSTPRMPTPSAALYTTNPT
jgi:hypothetical protein